MVLEDFEEVRRIGREHLKDAIEVQKYAMNLKRNSPEAHVWSRGYHVLEYLREFCNCKDLRGSELLVKVTRYYRYLEKKSFPIKRMKEISELVDAFFEKRGPNFETT